MSDLMRGKKCKNILCYFIRIFTFMSDGFCPLDDFITQSDFFHFVYGGFGNNSISQSFFTIHTLIKNSRRVISLQISHKHSKYRFVSFSFIYFQFILSLISSTYTPDFPETACREYNALSRDSKFPESHFGKSR